MAKFPFRGSPRGIQHVVSVSGGKDSDCCYLLALESGREFRAVMADVGNEHPDTYEWVARLHERTGGPKVEVVRANFDAEIAAKRMFIARDQRTGRKYKKPGSLGYGRRLRWSNKAKRRALEVLHPTGIPYLDLCMWKGRFPSSQAQFCTEELKDIPISTAEAVEWSKTTRGGKQYGMFFVRQSGGGCSSNLGHCERG